jgi:hypothetical protein
VASKTVVELLDDLDGGRADETVTFALDGVDYEIDLSTANAAALRGVLAEFVAHAHRAPSKARRTRVAKGAKVTPTGTSASMTAEIRRLASESAKKVSEAQQATTPAQYDSITELGFPDEVATGNGGDTEPVRALVIPFQEAGL